MNISLEWNDSGGSSEFDTVRVGYSFRYTNSKLSLVIGFGQICLISGGGIRM